MQAMNAFENTLIFFLSDNGADATIYIRGDGHDGSDEPGSGRSFLCLGPGWASACNTPFRRHTIWVSEGGISTPLIAHWPAGLAARGALRHQVGHVIDFVPTILDLAGSHPDRVRDMSARRQPLDAEFRRMAECRRSRTPPRPEGVRLLQGI
jgi:arylsulfatase